MSEGFIQIRRGLLDHAETGSVGLSDLGVYLMIHLQAHYETGIWIGSAAKLAATAPRDSDDRAIRRSLENLERVGFIKRFMVQGKRGNYPVLINKYEPQSGAMKGKRLNADLTTDWRHPVYKSCREVSVRCPRGVREDASILKEEVKEQRKERREKPAAKPTRPRPGDPRFRLFVDFAHGAFEAKYGTKPSWQGKDWKGLQNLLASNKSLGLLELQTRWQSYLDSTEAFTVKQGGSLAYFCAHADSFIAGPILAQRGSNGSAKPTVGDAMRTTLAGFRQLESAARKPN